MNNTKTRILDAAERILAERGFAAASVRTICAEAGVNLGAVNYHFRSKQALVRAVFARRMEPLTKRRLEALIACEARARGKPVPLPDLLSAFLNPVMRMGPEGTAFMRLMGRMYSEPSVDVAAVFTAELQEVVRRFRAAFRRALPRLPEEELLWRLFFTIGAMAQTLAAGNLLRMLSEERCDPGNLDEAESMLARFAEAGLTAPAAAPPKKTERRKERIA
jgi:AcrR family transcriptional regulator